MEELFFINKIYNRRKNQIIPVGMPWYKVNIGISIKLWFEVLLFEQQLEAHNTKQLELPFLNF